MVVINIFSILSYVVSIAIILKNKKHYITVWIMVLEVFLHVIFATIFFGTVCGYQQWLFGTLASVFLPYTPELSRRQKRQIRAFTFVVIATYIVLTALGNLEMLPTRYNVSPGIARFIFYCNVLLTFGSIMLYTRIYNDRVGAKQKELQKAADHDYLTGIFNRQRIQTILDGEVLRQQGTSQTNLSVAIVDIDFFKKINDTSGHITGDEALKELTKIFWKNSAEGMLYGRWGGEEFLLIAPEHFSYNQFVDLLERIRLQVEDNSFTSNGKDVKFTVSIGVATYEKGMTVEELVNLADDRLYHAKETGRNRTVYVSSGLTT